MARALAVAALAAAALPSCGQVPPEPLAPIEAGGRILAFGDSLTHGTGGAGTTYPDVLAELTGLEVVRSGIPGETSAAALDRFPQALETHRPALVILCTGGNDILRRRAGELEENLGRMADLAAQRGIPVVLVSVPRFSLIRSNHPAYGRVAGERRLWVEDEVLKRVLHDDRMKSDQIHPNARGYREIATALAGLLRASGALR